jgi:hypothetical protein
MRLSKIRIMREESEMDILPSPSLIKAAVIFAVVTKLGFLRPRIRRKVSLPALPIRVPFDLDNGDTPFDDPPVLPGACGEGFAESNGISS